MDINGGQNTTYFIKTDLQEDFQGQQPVVQCKDEKVTLHTGVSDDF